MTTDAVDSLEDLADRVDEQFESHRQPHEFKTISIVIDSSHSDRPTLIVHVNGERARSLATEVGEFLEQYNTRIQHEHHSKTDIRLLATLE